METHEINQSFEIEVKRLYIPFVKTLPCAHCGEDVEADLNCDYLSNPVVNEKEVITVYCDSCDEYSEFDVILRMSIDVSDEIKKQ